jgi:pantothenate kinase-related protein Tda10
MDGGSDSVAALLAAISDLTAARQRPLLVAVDGRSGAGKSTLAAKLGF